MTLLHPVLAAGTAAAVTVTVLLLALYGAWHACRDLATWADAHRRTRAWQQSTQAGGDWGDDDEPELRDDRPGTDTDALQTCRDIWTHTPNRNWEENP